MKVRFMGEPTSSKKICTMSISAMWLSSNSSHASGSLSFCRFNYLRNKKEPQCFEHQDLDANANPPTRTTTISTTAFCSLK